ncbi:hypothetical protein L3i22_089890 [Actinoplanes sp. L3-i22]|nr:hypothetical protein L3i22_089890 [Actinoplanes sp. L3-i22]
MSDSALFSHSSEEPESNANTAEPAELQFSHPTPDKADGPRPGPATPPDRIFSHPGAVGDSTETTDSAGRPRPGRADGQGVRRTGGGRIGRTDNAGQGTEIRRRGPGGRPGRADG